MAAICRCGVCSSLIEVSSKDYIPTINLHLDGKGTTAVTICQDCKRKYNAMMVHMDTKFFKNLLTEEDYDKNFCQKTE